MCSSFWRSQKLMTQLFGREDPRRDLRPRLAAVQQGNPSRERAADEKDRQAHDVQCRKDREEPLSHRDQGAPTRRPRSQNGLIDSIAGCRRAAAEKKDASSFRPVDHFGGQLLATDVRPKLPPKERDYLVMAAEAYIGIGALINFLKEPADAFLHRPKRSAVYGNQQPRGDESMIASRPANKRAGPVEKTGTEPESTRLAMPVQWDRGPQSAAGSPPCRRRFVNAANYGNARIPFVFTY